MQFQFYKFDNVKWMIKKFYPHGFCILDSAHIFNFNNDRLICFQPEMTLELSEKWESASFQLLSSIWAALIKFYSDLQEGEEGL
jgi:hypothetical protein